MGKKKRNRVQRGRKPKPKGFLVWGKKIGSKGSTRQLTKATKTRAPQNRQAQALIKKGYAVQVQPTFKKPK